MGEGAVVGQKLQDRAQQGVILRRKVGEQGRAAGPQGIRQGGGQQGEVLPEKGFPHCRPGGGPAGRRQGAVRIPAGEQSVGLLGRNALHGGGKPGFGQLIGSQCPRKPHPHRPVTGSGLFQHGGGQRQIKHILRQAQHLQKRLTAPGGPRRSVAVGKAGSLSVEGNRQLPRHGQQVQTVLGGVQVDQQKARLLPGGAEKQGHPVLGPG